MVGTLGLVNITAGGTPQRLATPNSVDDKRINGIRIQAAAGNAGIVYVGTGALVKATGVGVMGIIPKPASATTGPFDAFEIRRADIPADCCLSDFWIDGDTNDDVYVTYTQG